jgi:hypothetical protein
MYFYLSATLQVLVLLAIIGDFGQTHYFGRGNKYLHGKQTETSNTF